MQRCFMGFCFVCTGFGDSARWVATGPALDKERIARRYIADTLRLFQSGDDVPCAR
jgi:hypothetical protein